MSTMIRVVSLYLPLVITSPVFAQAPDSLKPSEVNDPHAVQPERPTVATHAGTVARGWLEIEAGIERDKLADGSLNYPTPILFKFGVGDHTQFGIFVSQIAWQNELQFGDIWAELKWRIMDDAPLLGDFALLPAIKIPTSSSTSGLGSNTFDFSMLLISSHKFGDISMDLNAGYTVRTGNGSVAPKSASLWTASFGGTILQALGWAFECYGYPGTSGVACHAPIVALLFGPTYLAETWLAFDTGLIVPIAGPQPHAVYAGVVWNVGKIW